MTTEKLILYGSEKSSATKRVQIAGALKGLEFEFRPVDLVRGGGEQHRAELRKLNPSREVPIFIHGPLVLSQSTAIIDYLDQVYPESSLFPTEPAARALVWQACEIINSGSHPIHNHRVDQQLEAMFAASNHQIREWMKFWVAYGLGALEEFLSVRAGLYSFGDRITAADCFLIPHLINARRIDLDLSPYPKLRDINKNCLVLNAFANVLPEDQRSKA